MMVAEINVMNFFFQHIEYLLLRHDCVIVPGLGAFIASMTPASIDMEKGIILPPSRSLMFNQAVTLDDGLLANSISRKSGLSFEESRQAIVRCVTNMKSILNSRGEIVMGNLGTLMRGTEGNLLFAPHAVDFSNASGMGYSSIKLSVPEVETKPSAPIISETPEIEDISVENEKNYYSIRISRAFARIASAVAVIAVVALTMILNPLPSDNLEQRASVVPVNAILPAATHQEFTDTVKTIVAEEVPVVKEEIAPAHYLIVATFSNEKEAKAYAERYSTDEFPLTAVASKRMTRVAAAASDNREELIKQLNSAAISSKFPNAWIWSRI